MLKNFEYCAPATIEEALTLLGRAGARVVAGGTDMLIHMRAGIASPTCLVDLVGLNLSYIKPEAEAAAQLAYDLLTDANVQASMTSLLS